MRCYGCNKRLSGKESTRRFKESEDFTDLCDVCLGTIVDEYDLDTIDGEAQDEDLFDDDGNPEEDY